MNQLKQLQKCGQSVWMDNLSRHIIKTGELRRLVDEDSVTGLTSNPTIFEKAIDDSTDYDEEIKRLLGADAGINAARIYERLSVEDIRMAADELRPVYEDSQGGDGYAS